MSTFCSSWTPCFYSCSLYFLLSRETEWLCILKQSSQQESDKNIFSSDLPSCWITGTEKQSVFWRTNQNSSQIIPLVSFIVHYEFSAQHTVWMQCEIHVQYSGIQSFHVEVKKACMQYDTKVCSSPLAGHSRWPGGYSENPEYLEEDWVRVLCIRVDPRIYGK